jgi:hypothetical protein
LRRALAPCAPANPTITCRADADPDAKLGAAPYLRPCRCARDTPASDFFWGLDFEPSLFFLFWLEVGVAELPEQEAHFIGILEIMLASG